MRDLFSFLQLNDFRASLLPLLRRVVDATIEIDRFFSSSRIFFADAGCGGPTTNVHGEIQKDLDVYAHRLFCAILEDSPDLFALASEESAHAIFHPQPTASAQYLLTVDPLDGSSNLEANISVGTIFSILPCPAQTVADCVFFQGGHQQLVAGYAIYGPTTQLVLTWGSGTHLFFLDRKEEVYSLIQQNLMIPASTSEFAINVSNRRFWSPPIQQYVAYCLDGETGPRQRHFNMRWVASMVADVHRLLTRGGIFLYPSDERPQTKNGRLRLLYEVGPIAWIIEQAGGLSTDGCLDSLLDIIPQSLHQRVSTILGSRDEVSYVMSLFPR